MISQDMARAVSGGSADWSTMTKCSVVKQEISILSKAVDSRYKQLQIIEEHNNNLIIINSNGQISKQGIKTGIEMDWSSLIILVACNWQGNWSGDDLLWPGSQWVAIGESWPMKCESQLNLELEAPTLLQSASIPPASISCRWVLRIKVYLHYWW